MDPEYGFGNGEILLECDVCGDKATGEHYRAITCNGCRDFFQRSIDNNMSYFCATKDCEISHKSTVEYCRYCHLYKCLSIGMTCSFVPRTWKRLFDRLTCDEPDNICAPNLMLLELGSMHAIKMDPHDTFDTSYATAQNPETVTIPPHINGNSDSPYDGMGTSSSTEDLQDWWSSSGSDYDGPSRDSDSVGVSSGTESTRASRIIEGVRISNSTEGTHRSRVIEVGSSNDMEVVETFRDMQAPHPSSRMENIVPDMICAARPHGMEGAVATSGVKRALISSDAIPAVSSRGAKRVAYDRSVQGEAIFKGVEDAGTSNSTEGAMTSIGTGGLGTSGGVKRAAIASVQDVGFSRGMRDVGMLGDMRGVRMYGGVKSMGIFMMKLVRISKSVNGKGMYRGINGSRNGPRSLRISLELRHAKKLLNNENFSSNYDVLTPNSLNLPLEVPEYPHSHLTLNLACESSSRLLFALSRWMLTLPHFATMPYAIQVSVYRETWPELLVLGLARWGAPIGLHELLPKLMQHLREELRLRALQISPGPNPDIIGPLLISDYADERVKEMLDLLDRLHQFVLNMEQMKVTDAEYAHLRALCLFATDRAPSLLAQKFEDFQSNVLLSLRAYTCDDEQRLTKLLLKLPTTRSFTDSFLEDVFFVGFLGEMSIDDAIPYILYAERQLN